MKPSTSQGFTLVELLIVIALMGIVLTLFLGASGGLFQKHQQAIDTSNALSALRRAQWRTVHGFQDVAWSVRFDESEMTLFLGTDFMQRDTRYDEVTEYSGGVSFEGVEEVTFHRRTGAPVPAGFVNILQDQVQVVIELNEGGQVFIQ